MPAVAQVGANHSAESTDSDADGRVGMTQRHRGALAPVEGIGLPLGPAVARFVPLPHQFSCTIGHSHALAVLVVLRQRIGHVKALR